MPWKFFWKILSPAISSRSRTKICRARFKKKKFLGVQNFFEIFGNFRKTAKSRRLYFPYKKVKISGHPKWPKMGSKWSYMMVFALLMMFSRLFHRNFSFFWEKNFVKISGFWYLKLTYGPMFGPSWLKTPKKSRKTSKKIIFELFGLK